MDASRRGREEGVHQGRSKDVSYPQKNRMGLTDA